MGFFSDSIFYLYGIISTIKSNREVIIGAARTIIITLPASSIFEAIAPSPASLQTSAPNSAMYAIPIIFSIVLIYVISIFAFLVNPFKSSITAYNLLATIKKTTIPVIILI